MPVHADDLPAATRRRLKLPGSRRHQFSREQLRSEAIGVLAQVRHLSKDQRRRVLEHALAVNEV